MVYNRECVTCNRLENCTRTSVKKILSHFVCESFEEVTNEEEVVKARCDIINKFGNAGFYVLAPITKEQPDE